MSFLNRPYRFLSCLLFFAALSGCQNNSPHSSFRKTTKILIGARKGCAILARLPDGRVLFNSDSDFSKNHAFPPGSVFKIVTASALVQENREIDGKDLYCTGRYIYRNKEITCVLHNGHGIVNLQKALIESCNFYFREASFSLSRDFLVRQGLDMGFISLNALPELAKVDLQDLVVGESATLSITPLDMVHALARWVAQGHLKSGTPQWWNLVHESLVRCVSEGTARPARNDRIDVAGKTGSPQVGKTKTDGWFVGYAPADKPSLAVVVFLQNSRGSEAAFVAGQLIEWYFQKESRFH